MGRDKTSPAIQAAVKQFMGSRQDVTGDTGSGEADDAAGDHGSQHEETEVLPTARRHGTQSTQLYAQGAHVGETA